MNVDEKILAVADLNKDVFGEVVINKALEKFKSIPRSIGSFKKEDVFAVIIYQTVKEMKDPFITIKDINHINENTSTLKKAVKTISKLFGHKHVDYSEYIGVNLKELEKQFSTPHPRTLAIIGLYLKGVDPKEIERITHSSYNHVYMVIKKFLGDGSGIYCNLQKCEKRTMDVRMAAC